MSKSIKALTASCISANATFANVSGSFADALNTACVSIVLLANKGGDYDKAAGVAKGETAFNYAAADERKQASFRKMSQYGRAIHKAWGSLTDAQRRDFANGKLLAYSLFKTLKPATGNGNGNGKAANDSAPAPAPAPVTGAEVIGGPEACRIVAKWLAGLADASAVKPAQAKALADMRRELEAFTSRASAAVKTPKARKAA